MKFQKTRVKDVYVVELEPREDDRGFFARTWCANEFRDAGLPMTIAQANLSHNNEAGTLRGFHYQRPPHQEAKFVRCIRGSIYDVAVDVRPNSPTFKKWVGVELSAKNRLGFFIPKGCAAAYLTLEDNTEVTYLADEFYHPESEKGIRWDDPAIGVDWPMEPRIITGKDRGHPNFE